MLPYFGFLFLCHTAKENKCKQNAFKMFNAGIVLFSDAVL
uniref:Uncharacterized protein n=1 Tax=Anguilla anguilla TaxID=7936 RepID=A0A0E9RL27_ANGAN